MDCQARKPDLQLEAHDENHRPLAVLFALAVLAAAPPCPAQPAPRQDLLALVPADVGFCVLVRDLRGQAQQWDRTPWVQALRKQPAVQAIIVSPEAKQLAAFEAELRKHLGVDWPTLRDDILGDEVVIAYRPGPPGQPEAEQGMIALRAAKPKRLAELVDRFNALQKVGGELKALDTCTHRGTTYYRRVHVRKTHYYYLHGPLLIVSGSETLLQQAIDREADAGGRWQSLAGAVPPCRRRAGAGHGRHQSARRSIRFRARPRARSRRDSPGSGTRSTRPSSPWRPTRTWSCGLRCKGGPPTCRRGRGRCSPRRRRRRSCGSAFPSRRSSPWPGGLILPPWSRACSTRCRPASAAS